MKARNWEYESYTPDREDTEAEAKARDDFMNQHLKDERRFTQLEAQMHFFIGGFYRGVAWAMAKYDVNPLETRYPEIMYAVGVRQSPNEFGMIGGPWQTEKEALESVPGDEYDKPIFLLKMEYQEPKTIYTPLYRWHDGQQRWRPTKMRRTT